jgi:hypothetical protein
MSPTYPRLFALSLGLALASTGVAQTAAPAADTTAAAAPAPAAATGAAPVRARRGGGPAAPDAPPAPWDRPPDAKPMFTEDFESGAINPKVWVTRVSGQPTITIEHDVVAHGKNALHIHYPAGTRNTDWAFIGMSMFPSLHDHLYGRAYMMIKGISATHSVYLLAGSVGFPIADFLEIGTDAGKFQPSFQLNAPTADRPRGEQTYHVGAFPLNRWFCLEWEFTETPARIVLWEDGKLIVNQTIRYKTGETGGLTRGFNEFDVGFRTWANPQPTDVDIYYDDIAISDKPIGQLTPVPDSSAAPAATSAAQ